MPGAPVTGTEAAPPPHTGADPSRRAADERRRRDADPDAPADLGEELDDFQGEPSAEEAMLEETTEDPAAADGEIDQSDEAVDPGTDDEASSEFEESEEPEAPLELAGARGRVSSGRSFLGFLLGLGMLVAVAGTVVLRVVEGVRWRIQRRRDER